MQDKIGILLAHSLAATRRHIASLLAALEDMALLAVASTGQEAVQRAATLHPDIVLVGSELPDMDSTEAMQQIVAKAPRMGVIVLATQEDHSYLWRCMHAGARSFLVAPFAGDELVAAIREVYARLQRERLAWEYEAAAPPGALARAPGKNLAVFGPKGGVGKTTCAVNLAIALQVKSERRVGLIDADFSFGDMHLFLNMKPSHTIIDFVEHSAAADAGFVRRIMPRHETGLRILARPARPELAELITSDHIRRLLGLLTQAYDFVIVDAAVSYDERMLVFLDNAHLIFLVVTPEVGPIHNANLFLGLAQALGYEREKIQLVLNRHDSQVGISAADVERSLNHPIAFKVASGGRLVVTSVNMGTPFVLSHASAEVSRDIQQMVNFVLKQLA